MTTINLPARPIHPTFAARRDAAIRTLATAARALGRLLRASRPSWTGLNAHLLVDIGESPASAEDEVLRDGFEPPLGTLGFGGGRPAGGPASRLG